MGIGNGFIVGSREEDHAVFVFTAGHVLADAADLILGAERRAALDHLETGGERLQRRVVPLI